MPCFCSKMFFLPSTQTQLLLTSIFTIAFEMEIGTKFSGHKNNHRSSRRSYSTSDISVRNSFQIPSQNPHRGVFRSSLFNKSQQNHNRSKSETSSLTSSSTRPLVSTTTIATTVRQASQKGPSDFLRCVQCRKTLPRYSTRRGCVLHDCCSVCVDDVGCWGCVPSLKVWRRSVSMTSENDHLNLIPLSDLSGIIEEHQPICVFGIKFDYRGVDMEQATFWTIDIESMSSRSERSEESNLSTEFDSAGPVVDNNISSKFINKIMELRLLSDQILIILKK